MRGASPARAKSARMWPMRGPELPAPGVTYDGRPLVTRPGADAGPGEPVVLVRHAQNPLSAAAEDLAALIAAEPLLQ